MSKIKVNINGLEITAESGLTIKQIAENAGIDIPTLCYDSKLKNYASCGICVVEAEGNPRLLRSCSTEAWDGMVVNTSTTRVKESRKTTLELFLSDHTGDCKAPCTLACPDMVDIQGYVGLIANKEYGEAIKLIKEKLPFPASIGRVCPHPCETACRRKIVEEPVSICYLKRYVADADLAKDTPYIPEIAPSTGKSVAIIGGGPSGLSAAYYLAKSGHKVTVYEAMSEFGGMLYYGIPMYRLPKEVLAKEVNIIKSMGVTLVPNTRIGRDVTLQHLRDSFDSVFVAVGMWNSAKMRLPGEDLEGVFGGIDFLNKFVTNKPINTGKRIGVIGGGNTAMDAARTAIRLGAEEVYVLYRRTKADMPAEDIEIVEAEEEGVVFKFLLSPVEFIAGEDGKFKSVRLQKMRAVKDPNGRNNIEPIEGEEEIIELDSIVVATGQATDLSGLEELEADRKGLITTVKNTFQTNLKGVFAGGDAIDNGNKIAIQAIADGRNAAIVIDSYLKGKIKPVSIPYFVKRENLTKADFPDKKEEARVHMEHKTPEYRKNNFEEFALGFTENEAVTEANRCLECGCMDYFECDLFRRANEYDIKPARFAGAKQAIVYKDEHPYIKRDPNKCILCGMCVRVCDEVMDNTALGLVGRGFGTVVKPAMGKNLSLTDCISCGQCVSVCPTGALLEIMPMHKQVPLKPVVNNSTCFGCSVGCNLDVYSRGSMIIKTQAGANDPVSGGLLCKKGRFEFDEYAPKSRVLKAMIKKDGALTPVDLRDALLLTARKMQSIQMLHGEDAVAISVSDMYTNEDITMIKKLADEMRIKNVFSFGYKKSGLENVLGSDSSTTTIVEIENTDLVLSFGGDIFKSHTMAGMKIKNAVVNGKKLISINDNPTKLDEWTKDSYIGDKSNFIKEVCKAIVSEVASDKLAGLEEFVSELDGVNVSEHALAVAKAYKEAKKAIIIYDKADAKEADEIYMAIIAKLTNRIGNARNGIVQLKAHVNSQGIVNQGIVIDRDEIMQKVQSGTIKGLLVLGEDANPEDLKGLHFLSVQSATMTELAKAADVVIPGSVLAESNGTVTTADGQIKPVNASIAQKVESNNQDICIKIMNLYEKCRVE